jgi:hypothetical protein
MRCWNEIASRKFHSLQKTVRDKANLCKNGFRITRCQFRNRYGNLYNLVDWEDDGRKIRSYRDNWGIKVKTPKYRLLF